MMGILYISVWVPSRFYDGYPLGFMYGCPIGFMMGTLYIGVWVHSRVSDGYPLGFVIGTLYVGLWCPLEFM